MRKLFSIALVLLVCFTTVFAGCGKEGAPKSSAIHSSKTVWKHDDTTHWQECSDPECGLVFDINTYYGQEHFLDKLISSKKLPKKADKPDIYAQLFGFDTFAEYLEVYNKGKAPHWYENGVCVCGKEEA